MRKTADQVMQASYTIEPRDTYIRTVIRTPNIVMYLNPIVRYDGVGFPSRRATPNVTASWLQRGFLVAAYAAVLFLLWRRPAPSATLELSR